MGKVVVTLTGTGFYYGSDFLEPGMKVTLKKEPDNTYDNEAILVQMKGLGKIGYVANSHKTVRGECFSAGRVYDKIDETAKAKVVLAFPGGAILKICKKSLIREKGPKHLDECLESEAAGDIE